MMPLSLSSRLSTPYLHLERVEEDKLYVLLEQTDKRALIAALNSSQRVSLKTLHSLLYKAFSEESDPDVVTSMIQTRSYASQGVLAHIIVEAMNNRVEDNEQELFVYELLSCESSKLSLLTEVLNIVSEKGRNLNDTSSLIEDLIQLAMLSKQEEEHVVHACPYMSEFILIDEGPFSNIVDDIKTKIGHFLGVRDLLRYGQISRDFNEAMQEAMKNRTRLIDFSQYSELEKTELTEAAIVTLAKVRCLNLAISATDKKMQLIGQLVNLRSLNMSEAKITDAGLHYLRNLIHLQTLDLGYTAVTDDGLHYLRNLIHLQTLDLGGTALTDDGLHHLEKLPHLQYLNLWDTQVTDEGLHQLEKLIHLQTLNLSSTKVTDDGLHHLEKLPHLHTLSLCNTKVTDAGLRHLGKLTLLQILRVRGKVTGEGLHHLQKLTHLRALYLGETSLSGTKVTDAGLHHLEKLTHLQTLDLSSSAVTDTGLLQLGKLTNLNTLNLVGTAVTDAGLHHLENLTNLKTLYLLRTAVTIDGLKHLKKLLPNLVIRFR